VTTALKRIVATVLGAGAMMLAAAHGPAFCPYCAVRNAPAAVHQAALGCEIRGQADCGP
jgi:hypothetical protein